MLKNVMFSLVTFLLFFGNSLTQYRHVPEYHFDPRERNEEFSRMIHHHTGQRYSDPQFDYQDYGARLQHDNKDDTRDYIPIAENVESVASASQLSETNAGITSDTDSGFEVVPNWPAGVTFGQVSAVSIDMDGNVVVFHRGSTIWSAGSFNETDNRFTQIDKGPITENTIIVLNHTTGQVIEEWGSDMFYMPHGLTVDHENNVWVTDVALHQVLKFSPTEKKQAVLTLGTKFTPGLDEKHYCKPTDVAVLSDTGEFFVSDGYCNSRIIKYSKEGKQIMELGHPTPEYLPVGHIPQYFFSVPHALALVEDKKLLCVADREHGRVECFNSMTGMFVNQIRSEEMGSRIFSVAYSPAGDGFLYVVNGPEFIDRGKSVSGFVINLDTLKIVEQFMPNGKSFSNPHDIAVSAGGKELYVVELQPFTVWKFMKGSGDDPVLRTSVNKSNVPSSASLLLPKANTEKIQPGSNTENTSIDSEKHHSSSEESSKEKSQTSGATAIGVVIGAAAVVGVVILIALIRMRKRGCRSYGYMNHSDRWKFPISAVESFKVSQFLDHHKGFEKVRTEESDDEGSSGSSVELGTTANQFA